MTGTFETATSLSFIDASAKILDLNGSPLHYRDITQQALSQGLIQSDGKTPEATLNAVICVDIKQKGIHSRFARVRPGIFGLRSWGIESAAVDSPLNTADAENRRVRIPQFPSYLELRLLLPIWNGRLRSQITGLRSTIETLRGSPQEPGDWTKPDRWITERLQGKDRELAETIWQKTAEQVNPRHVYGHWLFACAYKLLLEDSDGQMKLTDRGRDFIDRPRGDTVALVDEQEGVLKILTIAAEKGTGRRSDFIPEWTDYLTRHSRYGTDSTIKDTLSRRLHSILERDLLTKAGAIYGITDEGLAYLRQTGGDEPADSSIELQEILQLVNQQKASVRVSMQELLSTMEHHQSH